MCSRHAAFVVLCVSYSIIDAIAPTLSIGGEIDIFKACKEKLCCSTANQAKVGSLLQNVISLASRCLWRYLRDMLCDCEPSGKATSCTFQCDQCRYHYTENVYCPKLNLVMKQLLSPKKRCNVLLGHPGGQLLEDRIHYKHASSTPTNKGFTVVEIASMLSPSSWKAQRSRWPVENTTTCKFWNLRRLWKLAWTQDVAVNAGL